MGRLLHQPSTNTVSCKRDRPQKKGQLESFFKVSRGENSVRETSDGRSMLAVKEKDGQKGVIKVGGRKERREREIVSK